MTATLLESAAPRPQALDATSVADAIDLFFRGYAGRDHQLPQRLAFWRDQIGGVPIAAVTPEHIDAGLEALTARGIVQRIGGRLLRTGRPLAPATLNRHVVAFQILWRGCQTARLISRTLPCPAKGFVLPEPEGRVRYLTHEEFGRLRYWAARSRWPRLEAMVVLAVTTALRAGALSELRWRDIDLARGTVTIARAKNGRPHVAALVPAARASLEALPGSRQPEHCVFRGRTPDQPHAWRKAFEVARRRAGLEDGEVCFHTLRHTAASWAALAGCNPLEIARLTGHRSLKMVQRYTHLDTSHLQAMTGRIFGGL